MPLTKINDIAYHEAGHVLICYLMDDLAQLHRVTIDADYGKTIDKHSDGGLIFRYLRQPGKLNLYELDQFCLLHLGGLAADLVNEYEGKIEQDFFYSQDFINKIGQYHYQGDMIAFSNTFNRIQDRLQMTPQNYNYISINLLTNILSDRQILRVLIDLRNLIHNFRTIDGNELTDFLNDSCLQNYRRDAWSKVKEIRKGLFDISSV